MTVQNALVYMRTRYYSPEIKRFVNQDNRIDLGLNRREMNRYRYVGGNPISYIDVDGEKGKITIYAHYGHAWISYQQEGDSRPIYYGTWGNLDANGPDSAFAGVPMSEKNGLYVDHERDVYLKQFEKNGIDIWEGRVSLTREISDEQENKLYKYINKNRSWSIFNNCSSFARNAWKAAGQGSLAYITTKHTQTKLRIPTPDPIKLMESIKGHKRVGTK